MKKEYARPEITISLFTTEDVITASSPETPATTMSVGDAVNIGSGIGGLPTIDVQKDN